MSVELFAVKSRMELKTVNGTLLSVLSQLEVTRLSLQQPELITYLSQELRLTLLHALLAAEEPKE